ncbi:MAG: DUF885 domain-containing protein [Candidatus Marinimicrobia bacterium]|nr:DUF885 domain-containing protein [Candidatus Neomarinimicrobiota bacterium]
MYFNKLKIRRMVIVLLPFIFFVQCGSDDSTDSFKIKVSKADGNQLNEDLQSLASEFFNWRSVTQPATSDDIPRVERPDNWHPEYSQEAILEIKTKYKEFVIRLEEIPKQNWLVSDSVDYLILRSAMERVNWEFTVLNAPSRNPDFYIQQTLGAVFELLLISTPMTELRAANIITILNSFSQTVEDAKINLTDPVASFADIALGNLENIRKKLEATNDALMPLFPESLRDVLGHASENAIKALEDYTKWLKMEHPAMTNDFSVGREGYEYFLDNIALIPYSPEELLQQGELEWNRSLIFEEFEQLRNANLPELTLFANAEEQISRANLEEENIRLFLEEKNIMTVPESLSHYINVKTPAHLAPLAYMGVMDDLTSESRLKENAVKYIKDPSPDLPYFSLSMAQDPRAIIIHEGVPGHYFQMALSWSNPDPIRRHFIDSGANEGIGFYVEEMMLQFGLFDDSPRSREIIYSYMRLRALRVEVDIRLAVGEFDIEEAGEYLEKKVPLDKETAIEEAGFFAYNPGQAISYQIGKLQIMKFLSDAKIMKGEKFDLRDFHDYLMVNGNVPIALLRWEYLGLRDEIKQFFN